MHYEYHENEDSLNQTASGVNGVRVSVEHLYNKYLDSEQCVFRMIAKFRSLEAQFSQHFTVLFHVYELLNLFQMTINKF